MRTVMIVGRHLPGHQMGLEESGAARHLGGLLRHFTRRGDRIVFVLLGARLTTLSLRSSTLGYEVVGPELRALGARTVVVAPRAVAATCAYAVFARLPRGLQRAVDALRFRLRRRRGFNHVVGAWLEGRERAFVLRVVKRRAPDVVLFDDIFTYCEVGARERWIIAHDVKHQRAESFREQSYCVLPRDLTEAREREIVRRCGNVRAIQWDDADEFRRMCRSARVVVAPIAVEPPRVARRPVPGRLVFIASGALPNVDGLRWFLGACWPAIRARLPAATLDVYGSVGFRLDAPPEGVHVAGVVDDIAAAYAQAAAAIVPLRVGSGLKVKLVEALCHGVPAVTTLIGAQGLGGLTPLPFALAEDAAAFVDATVRVLTDEAYAAALERAANAAARRFAPETAYGELDAALDGPRLRVLA